jgi:hypothetical protein
MSFMTARSVLRTVVNMAAKENRSTRLSGPAIPPKSFLKILKLHIRVVDPHWFNADPDPDPDPIPDPGFWWTKTGKNLQFEFFFNFWSKIAIYLSLRLPKGRPSYRRSLQPSKENIFTFFYFFGSFLPSWIRICILNADPDPATQIYAIPSGSTTLLHSKMPSKVERHAIFRVLSLP